MNRVARGNDVRPGISRRVAVSALKRQETAAETAEAPGIGKTLILFLKHSSTNIAPGSDTDGVPASEIKDTIQLDFNIDINFNKFFFSLNL